MSARARIAIPLEPLLAWARTLLRDPVLGDSSGQVISLWIGVFLIAASVGLGFGYDLTMAWMAKQRADIAAHAACSAGAMDMLWAANNNTNSTPVDAYNFLPSAGGTAKADCKSSQNSAMCYYAGLNGFKSTGLDASKPWSNDVAWAMSTTPPVNAGSSALTTTANGVPAYMNVTVTQNVPVSFLGLLYRAAGASSSSTTIPIAGHSTCGITSAGAGSEEAITSTCPFDETVYDAGDWESVNLGQLRSPGSTNYPTHYVFFKCNDQWIDQNGAVHPWNYMSTLTNVTIDDVSMRTYLANQGVHSAYSVLYNGVVVGASSPFSALPCASSVPGVIDTGATDYFIPFEVNKGAAEITELDTNKTYSPWRSNPPNWSEPLLPAGQYGAYMQYFPVDTYNLTQPYEPENWSYQDATTGSSVPISNANDSAALVDALSNDIYFGFGWCIQGNGSRNFIGNRTDVVPPSDPGSMTIYYHQRGMKATTF